MTSQQAEQIILRLEAVQRGLQVLADAAPVAWSLGWLAQHRYPGIPTRTLQQLATDAGISLGVPWRETMLDRAQCLALDQRVLALTRR